MAEIVYPLSLITDEYMKAYSPLPTNYNLDEIRGYIHVSEILWVVPIIGEPLYQKLLDEVEEDNVPEEDATLLLHIYPLLGNATVFEALPFVAMHLSQVGITKGKSENSDSVTTKDVNYISNHLRNQCETLKAMLKKFLDENADLYPDYYPDKTCECKSIDECNCDVSWLYQYYGGIGDKYEIMRRFAEKRMSKFKPNSYNQLYTPRRVRINLQ